MMIKIRRIKKGESGLYRKIRLTALKDAPYAFDSTYASSLERSLSSWENQTDSSASGAARSTFIALNEKEPVAIAAIYQSEESGRVAELLQVWVSSELRGGGLAKRMIDVAFDWARENGYSRILAEVRSNNHRALNFYTKYGFKVIDKTDNTVRIQKRVS